VLQAEREPAPTHNIQLILPSGVAVIGIDSWVVRFTWLFENAQSVSDSPSSDFPGWGGKQSYTPEDYIPGSGL
jgi:hypothetical protein